MSTPEFESWFEKASGFAPRDWQCRLGADRECRDRLIRIPTGFGKTLGVVASWAYHRLVKPSEDWPRRLVLVLPMRVLVEQVAREAAEFLIQAGLRRSETGADELGQGGGVAVHVLMGGVAAERWHLCPEQPAVLVGTQDMLLSRALNRGYASPRPRWPMEYGLLQQDALWVLDEVQLMGVGLTTAMQLQHFRSRTRELRPTATWCMSATLQPRWLEHGHGRESADSLRSSLLTIPAPARQGGLFAIRKAMTVEEHAKEDDPRCKAWGERVRDLHCSLVPGEHGRVTLTVCNTVDEACLLHDVLAKLLKGTAVELRLVHSRFRGVERAAWSHSFLRREACGPDADRILVATQVVEAGVDISAGALVTQLAPWASLVQRIGRCARYGGSGKVLVVDRLLNEKQCKPYAPAELQAAKDALRELDDVGTASLEAFEEEVGEKDPSRLQALYPYEPLHVIHEVEFEELFDTEGDLTGQDLDVSRFIREGDERDLSVFWAEVDARGLPPAELQPTRAGLCPVPVARARAWLMAGARLKDGVRAWAWDYLDGEWRRLGGTELRPGQLVLVDVQTGGYDTERGFTGAKPGRNRPSISLNDTLRSLTPEEQAELGPAREELSAFPYKTIATHGRETAQEATKLSTALGLPLELQLLVELAALLHDVGKSHPVFVRACNPEAREPGVRQRLDLAKAPSIVWRKGADLFRDLEGRPRPGFRHELVSALMVFEWLRSIDPSHPALLGPHEPLVEAGLLGAPGEEASGEALGGGLAERLTQLDAAGFDLVVYLICAHHGKVRGTWSATAHDQGANLDSPELAPIRGVLDGDSTPPLEVALAGGGVQPAPGVRLSMAPARLGLSARYGASWRERVGGLRRRWGPSSLAFLETLLRVADTRASRKETPDPLLQAGGAP